MPQIGKSELALRKLYDNILVSTWHATGLDKDDDKQILSKKFEEKAGSSFCLSCFARCGYCQLSY